VFIPVLLEPIVILPQVSARVAGLDIILPQPQTMLQHAPHVQQDFTHIQLDLSRVLLAQLENTLQVVIPHVTRALQGDTLHPEQARVLIVRQEHTAMLEPVRVYPVQLEHTLPPVGLPLVHLVQLENILL
jgi:hypothetical protein